MKNRVTLWAEKKDESKVFVALELNESENNYLVHIFEKEQMTEELAKAMNSTWRSGADVEMPGHEIITLELSIQGDFLPQDLKADDPHLITRLQTEWHFNVLSHKMSAVYKEELGELKTKVDQATEFSKDQWNDLKEFWSKVQGQISENNILRKHANDLRKESDQLFSTLKEKRKELDKKFKSESQEVSESFNASLENIEKKIADGSVLRPVFDELRSLQGKLKGARLTREHRQTVWNRLDAAFKAVKEKRFGDQKNRTGNASDRLTRRKQGLIKAMDRMEKSIKYDQSELDYQDKRIDNAGGQLEQQLREAKKLMIAERLNSKKAKFDDMKQTMSQIDSKIEKEKAAEARRAEKKAIEDAKKKLHEAKQKEIADKAAEAEDPKLKEAAEKILQAKRNKEKAQAQAKAKAEKATASESPKEDEPSMVEEIVDLVSASAGEAFEDVIDTVKAISHVVKQRMSDEEE